MKQSELLESLENNPVIAAIKNDQGLEKSLHSRCPAVFILYGSVVTVSSLVERVKEAGKAALVHVDLIDGLSAREAAVDFVAAHTRADGILSTKITLVHHAKERGLLAIQRFFLLDSMALDSIHIQSGRDRADLIEVLPGVMPKVLRRLTAGGAKPVIAGGLISDKEDVIAALGAGACGVSSSNPEIWFL